ncbi:hypothetical protein ONA91_07165 [Micromonospora sp. DR5-3]|uniref:hypothetical protein n=1 Tax=unclassified Micromonospora TaxID=2617518 RepID=UPI0021077B4A|nr:MULTISPECIES: hypothetical protein [unclassified Micromonospora]MCW3814235.1 hypothetical protein [Micromonospora sp. DR5-3]
MSLLVYLGGMLHDAAGELHLLHPQDGPEPSQLYARFLGWAVGSRRDPFTSSSS